MQESVLIFSMSQLKDQLVPLYYLTYLCKMSIFLNYRRDSSVGDFQSLELKCETFLETFAMKVYSIKISQKY